MFCSKKKLVDAVIRWVEKDNSDGSAWEFSDDGILTGYIYPELEQWFAWFGSQAGMMPTEWRQQPLRQLIINNTLTFIAHTWRNKMAKDFDMKKLNATQTELIGWIDGSE